MKLASNKKARELNKKFGRNRDAKVINSMLPKHIDDIDLSIDADLETSDSDYEVEDQVNESEQVKMQISNETSDSNSIEASSDEVERQDIVLQQQNDRNENQNDVSCIEDSKACNELDARAVFVKQLPPSIKEIHLQHFFSRYGKIEKITMDFLFNGTVSAYILFEREKDADKSLEAFGMEYKGNYLVMHKPNRLRKNEDDTYAVFVSWKRGVDTGLFLTGMESFGVVKFLYFDRLTHCVSVYFESVDSVELALAAGRITVGTYELYINKNKPDKRLIPHKQHQEYRGIRKKRPFKQGIQHKQYHTNLEPSIQIHKNKYDDSVTISFNKGGYEGSKHSLNKQYKVRSGFVEKRRQF